MIKKFLSVILALVMLLSMTACGGSAEPVETAPATTEAPTTAPTEAPTEAPAEDPNAYTAYTLGESESYVDVVWRHGFWEVDMEECVAEAEENGATGAQATPLSLELSQNGFRMEVDYSGYDYSAGTVISFGTVELVGAKSDGLADISGINPEEYEGYVNTGEVPLVNDVCLSDNYLYYNFDANGDICDLVYITATYYVLTDNLYNIIYHVPNGVNEHGFPVLLYSVHPNIPHSPFYPTVQTLTYGDFTFEMSQFAIQCGEERYVYDYRPGMSLSDWACSKLNTDGWIPWYGDTVLSPDRAYICDTAYLDIQEYIMGTRAENLGNLLVAEEYDGSINRFNNGYTSLEVPGLADTDLSGSNGVGATMLDAAQVQEFMAQHGLNSTEELQEYINQNGIEGLIGGTVQPDSEDGEVTSDNILDGIASEENEIMLYGNISVSVAHMVNAKTPLFTPGFRIISKEGGLAAYHSVEMSYDLLRDDILDIYMNGIADELIPHIKLYAFSESEEFLKSLEDHTKIGRASCRERV